MISQSWCCPWGRPQCRFCLAGTLAVIIYNIFIPSKETSTYNQAQTWFAVVISVWQVFCSLVVRTIGGAVIYAQRLHLGGHLNEWSFRLMPFPSPPAECKDPNPRWSELTHLHQLRSCCTGFLAERTWSVGHGGGRGVESKWPPDQVYGWRSASLGWPTRRECILTFCGIVSNGPSLLHSWDPAETRSFAESRFKPGV